MARRSSAWKPCFCRPSNSWRSGGATDKAQPAGAKAGTLDWLFAQYRGDRRFTKLDDKTRRTHELGFRLVGGYTLKDGRRLGQASLSAITTAIADLVFEKLVTVQETDADGKTVERERRTTINHAMKSCRRAWNVAARANPGRVPLSQPLRPHGAHGRQQSDADSDLSGTPDLPRQGEGNGIPVAGDRGAGRVGISPTRGGYFRDVCCGPLSAKRAGQCGAGAARKDPRGELDSSHRRGGLSPLSRTDGRTRRAQARSDRRPDAAPRLGRSACPGRRRRAI